MTCIALTEDSQECKEHAEAGQRSREKWHVLFATWLGELFDGMDASLYALVMFPALSELLKTNSHATVGVIGSIVLATFMVGWAAGSVLFGIMADRLGRAKTMMITILLYALFTGLCGLAQSWQELAFYRFLVGCGIGGEISIGAVMLSEYWKGKSRLHAVAALSTSFGFGYLIAAILNLGLGQFGWRWLFFAGVAPALVTLYMRAKLKEPEQFVQMQQLRKQLKELPSANVPGEVHHLLSPSLAQLFTAENRTKVFCVIGLASASIIGYWAVLSWIPPWINQLTGTNAVVERSTAAIVMNIGAILAAGAGGFIIQHLGRARAFRLSFGCALLTCLGMFLTVKSFSPVLLMWVFFIGGFATLPFVILFCYVPELFSANIRGTAFGFSVQVGRIFAATAALLGGQIIAAFAGSYATAASTVSLMYGVGFICTLFMPKTSGEVRSISLDRDALAKTLSTLSVADRGGELVESAARL